MTVAGVFIIVMFVVMIPLTIWRFHVRGPAIQAWVPRSLRPRLNDWYERHGWEAPYDTDLEKKRGRW